MNIFLVDPSPTISAQALDDLRLNKMILETAQLLSGAYRHFAAPRNNCLPDVLYKLTHANHPCSIFARSSPQAYNWLLSYFKAMHDERMYRTGKTHLSYTKLWDILVEYETDDDEYPAFTFDCSNQNLFRVSDIFTNYKQCLTAKWLADKRKPTWTKRGQPDWFNTDNKAA